MPTHYLALDIGSTTVVAIVIDLDTNAVVGTASAANSSEVTSAADKRLSRSEWDLDGMTELAIDNAAALVARTNARPAAIGVTGQQQGLQLLDAALKTVGPYFSWQDQRAQECLPNQQHTYLDLMAQRGGSIYRRGRDACLCQYGLPSRGRSCRAAPVLAASQQSASQRRQRHQPPQSL